MAERSLLGSWIRMIPELLRYSSSIAELDKFPPALREAHRADDEAQAPVVHIGSATRLAPRKGGAPSLWDDWTDNPMDLLGPVAAAGGAAADDGDDVDLSALGL